MAHHRPDLLSELLSALDDERNDIFVHIDSKAGPDMAAAQFRTESSRLFFVPRKKVAWGGYSQIECEIRLLKEALRRGPYAFYHLMTGASYPLRSQDAVHAFFQRHAGYELLSVTPQTPVERVRYKWLFNETGKYTRKNRLRYAVSYGFVKLQELMNADFFTRFGMELKKGFAYWSITDDAAGFIIGSEALIRKMMRWSVCGDEIFVQTLLYNSRFRDRICNYDEPGGDRLWINTWLLEDRNVQREDHSFCAEDLALLLRSDALFAMKFEGSDGLFLISEIKKNRKRETADSEVQSHSGYPCV